MLFWVWTCAVRFALISRGQTDPTEGIEGCKASSADERRGGAWGVWTPGLQKRRPAAPHERLGFSSRALAWGGDVSLLGVLAQGSA